MGPPPRFGGEWQLMKSSLAAFALPRQTLDSSPSTHCVAFSALLRNPVLHSSFSVCLPIHPRSLPAGSTPHAPVLPAAEGGDCSTICPQQIPPDLSFPTATAALSSPRYSTASSSPVSSRPPSRPASLPSALPPLSASSPASSTIPPLSARKNSPPARPVAAFLGY